MSDDLYYFAFSHFVSIGPIRFRKLMNHFGSAKKAYEANIKNISMIIGSEMGEKFSEFRNHFNVLKEYKRLEEKGILFLPHDDSRFPPELNHIPDPPIGLYIKGNIKNFDFLNDICLGIVGARRPSSYGEKIAKKFSSELAVLGIVTVSGMAMGIDGIVHESSLEVQGKTIAVLGCGVDIVYPSCNRALYENIIKNNGLVISEFLPGQRPVPGYFILRNRLISGLSKGVLVIEGMKDSGTLITARCAAEQGKEVFAVPSPITSSLSEAPNLLLKQGAKLVTSLEDVIEELGLKIEIQSGKSMKLDGKEKEIYETLKKEPKSADELEMELHIPIQELSQIISMMEIKGELEKNNEGKYQIR